MTKVDIIGAGLSGLYAACLLSKNGYEVVVHEKNDQVGGRSRVFEADGFTFDMGPSWYWMPELIDELIAELGEDRKNYYTLTRLDPAYRLFWKDHEPTDIPADFTSLKTLFESFEKDGGNKLHNFLLEAEKKYQIATANFIEKPGIKWREILNLQTFKHGLELNILKSVDKDVSSRFESPYTRAILNFPVLFLGAMPNRIPSLYTMMNYADMKLGTWYPEGGMGALAKALEKIALKNGVQFNFNASVEKIRCENDQAIGIQIGDNFTSTDELVISADYHFVEQHLLPEEYRKYSEKYWDSRKLAPSCLIYYLGINKKVKNLLHHNLFFDEDLETHGKTIYDSKSWPDAPLFYVCCPSKTDVHVAPEGFENLFVLIPIAPDLIDTDEIKEKYLSIILDRIEKHTGDALHSHIVYKRSYCVSDFKADYNAYKGNAYGLANTLNQTANLKPKIKSKLKNMHYCGQLTVPGPGVPPALISGKIVAKQLISSQ